MSYIKNKKELIKYFNETYYNSINYLDYKLREEKYLNTAKDLIEFSQLFPLDNVLDYGCAVGLLMSGYENLNMVNVFGFDISEWALSESLKKNLKVSNNLDILHDKQYKLTTALDVFEHMFDEDVNLVLNLLNTEFLIVRIPVKLDGENDFHLEVSRRDPSHVNCKTKKEWVELIQSFGFKFLTEIKTENIYDTPGVFCGYFQKTEK